MLTMSSGPGAAWGGLCETSVSAMGGVREGASGKPDLSGAKLCLSHPRAPT